jgi:hypothetical protein
MKQGAITVRSLAQDGKDCSEVTIGHDQPILQNGEPPAGVIPSMFTEPGALAVKRSRPDLGSDRRGRRRENVGKVTHVV